MTLSVKTQLFIFLFIFFAVFYKKNNPSYGKEHYVKM